MGAELPQSFTEQIEKANIETETLSLLTVDAIPEDADAVMIYSPSSDLSGNRSRPAPRSIGHPAAANCW